MSQVWHLVRHNLRAHRTLLLAWLATAIALPILANLPWSDQLAAGFGVGAAMALQAARVLLGMTAIASIVQADSPIDDRAFWRTRPIAPSTLAAAHLLTVGAIFVVLPTMMVFGVAVLSGVPRAHWLSAILQVVAMETSIASFALVSASRTRGIATFIIAAVVGLISFYLFVGALFELRRALEWPDLMQMADPRKAFLALLAVATLFLPVLFTVAMAGPRRRQTFLAGVMGVLVLATGVWFLPALRFVPPPTVDAELSVTETSMRVEAVPDSPGAVALVLAVRPSQGHPRDEWRFWLKSGALSTTSGMRALKGSSGGNAPRVKQSEASTVVAVLSPDEFTALAGTRIRLDGVLQGDVERRITESQASLAPGAAVGRHNERLRITLVREGSPDLEKRRLTLALGTEIRLISPVSSFGHVHVHVLRDDSSGCELPAYSWSEPSARVMQVALLPTVFPPFMVSRIELAVGLQRPCDVDLTRTTIEMRNVTRSVGSVPVSIEFTLPATLPVS